MRFPRPRLPRPSRPRLRRPAARRGPGWPRRGGRLAALRPSRFASITERLRDAGYAVEDAAFAAGRVAGGFRWRSDGDLGSSGSASRSDTRLRLALALGAVVALGAGLVGRRSGASLRGAGRRQVPARRRRDPARSRGRAGLRARERRPRHRAVRGRRQGLRARSRDHQAGDRPRRCRSCRGRTAPRPTSSATSSPGSAARRRWRSCPPAAAAWASRSSCSRPATTAGRASSPIRSRPATPRSTTYREVEVQRRSARAGDRAGRRLPRDRHPERRAGARSTPTAGRRGRALWPTIRRRARRGTPSPTSASPTPISPPTASRSSSPTRAGRWPRSAR